VNILTKASAASPTVGQSNGPRELNGASKAVPDATTKAAIRNVGNGKSKPAAPAKPSSKTPRIKVKKYSLTMPKPEHDLVVALKGRLNEQGIKVKKSELIRVGIQLFVGLSDTRVKAALRKILADTDTEDKTD
jgi:hypothetical protein